MSFTSPSPAPSVNINVAWGFADQTDQHEFDGKSVYFFRNALSQQSKSWSRLWNLSVKSGWNYYSPVAVLLQVHEHAATNTSQHSFNSFKLLRKQAYRTFTDWLELFRKSAYGGCFQFLLMTYGTHGTQIGQKIKACAFSYMLPAFNCSYNYFDRFCWSLSIAYAVRPILRLTTWQHTEQDTMWQFTSTLCFITLKLLCKNTGWSL